MQPDELKALRKSEKMTQGALAEALGLSLGFIGEMERGEKAIDFRTEITARLAIAKRTIDRLEADPATAGALTALKADLFDKIASSIGRS